MAIGHGTTLNQIVYTRIEAWCYRPIGWGCPFLDSIVLKRNWDGQVMLDSSRFLVVVFAYDDNYRFVLALAEDQKEDTAGWSTFWATSKAGAHELIR